MLIWCCDKCACFTLKTDTCEPSSSTVQLWCDYSKSVSAERRDSEHVPKLMKLKLEYLMHAACIRTVSSQLDECTEDYVKSQKMLDSHSDPSTLKQRTCCIYFENIRCSSNATREACGQEASELVRQLWRLLGGSYLNELCEPYLDYDSESCTPTSKSMRFRAGANIFSVLFPFLYSAASRYLRFDG
ncbi:hypothetical protein AVEN_143107-1 [Araneus ventricosus]|uniref:Uncharacterized protein n=1 Tax=Araneus ventricosus TaxID=182803 RepID=A0A4Y2VWW3_ARAVE|nr:hypothetical protein AVEN_17448-1 [Araneus ventricosus]GBO28856.1 hypothetical protein AVEN_105274-1 [Araneus ventricosus]GBO28857.1 hypothetical protein AVEN_125074-1 [Araneus ventricosus]GBO28858.1 hypothetical protein AVEN_143107-1 [Araneus ventricosus]